MSALGTIFYGFMPRSDSRSRSNSRTPTVEITNAASPDTPFDHLATFRLMTLRRLQRGLGGTVEAPRSSRLLRPCVCVVRDRARLPVMSPRARTQRYVSDSQIADSCGAQRADLPPRLCNTTHESPYGIAHRSNSFMPLFSWASASGFVDTGRACWRSRPASCRPASAASRTSVPQRL